MGGRLYPSLEEMHPSKVHTSTMKEPDVGLHLGFTDIEPRTGTNRSKAMVGAYNKTPTKSREPVHKAPSSPGFEFKFTGRRPELGPEAQKMMEDLREEAGRIKHRLAADQQEEPGETHQEREDDAVGSMPERKIAKAKGKAGRFSNAHMAEFRKMDSIAAHPSAHRLQPTAAQSTPPAKPSLKRSKSQARLDHVESACEPTTSAAAAAAAAAAATTRRTDSRVETGNTGKRMKMREQDDTSSVRPVSRDERGVVGGSSNAQSSSLAAAQSRSGFPTAMTTPTKASLARSASVKHAKTLIPSLARSASTRNVNQAADAAGAQSEGSRKQLSPMTSLGRVKSILRCPGLFQAASTTAPSSGKEASPPPLPVDQPPHKISTGKHVTFMTAPTPSPEPRQPSAGSSPVASLVQQSPSRSKVSPIKYPTLPPVPAPLSSSSIGDFTFSTGRTMKFGANAVIDTSNPFNGTTTGTAGTAGTSSAFKPSGGSTIRHVRPSVGPGAGPGPGPGTPSAARAARAPNKMPPMGEHPSVPHGMSNKKRHRSALDDSDEENHDPRAATTTTTNTTTTTTAAFKKRKHEGYDDDVRGGSVKKHGSASTPQKLALSSSSPAKRFASRIPSSLKRPRRDKNRTAGGASASAPGSASASARVGAGGGFGFGARSVGVNGGKVDDAGIFGFGAGGAGIGAGGFRAGGAGGSGSGNVAGAGAGGVAGSAVGDAASPCQRSRGILSVSRLNALARPKHRRG